MDGVWSRDDLWDEPKATVPANQSIGTSDSLLAVQQIDVVPGRALTIHRSPKLGVGVGNVAAAV